ncbi:MAG: pantoate--beta-alanine ligase [Candidatus Omnitrophica bacterium]|nr:pantoate--beta-alanine ligase [Candidatus Omnitrophota bacterium]MBU1047511.1 pantoate--beta-alanine ligase [Candidatus Omnitrophota bacterium]MBU1631240.1 pantoate--beta-alanine ligase [Candidatus Omnitrophota bacterium]MBU1888874.1 pantoate--beta-alanine ligase [Candidatus Omnitrophota bacterium]
MKIIKKPYKLTARIKAIKKNGKTVGFVPTMGSLHEGHISLIKKARKENEIVVLSIFVNPTQFGPKEDYKKYPRNFSRDKAIAKKAGVDIVFAPSAENMYPEGVSTCVEETNLSKILEGAIRPGHFKGVTTVVLKLFNIVQPDISYFGQKDYQQAVIIKKMVKDLNLDTNIKVLPTVREKDSLALSSRNIYLNQEERKSATILCHSLTSAKKLIENGLTNTEEVKKKIRTMIKKEKISGIDYIEIRELETLQPVKKITGKVVILLAVRIGKVRLLDNMIIK